MPLIDDTRADWGATPSKRTLTKVARSNRIGVSWHWIGPGRAPSASGSHNACLRKVKEWQAYHRAGPMQAKDIGYNVLICQHARAIEGRGIDFAGSHSPGVNTEHIGVQFMAGIGDPLPSPAMLARAVTLRADLAALCKNLRRDWPHRADPAASTECPGDGIAAWVNSGGPTKTNTPAPATPSGVYPGAALKRGDTGPKVAEIQTRLGITADGSYGPGTESAVHTFQTANGLDADGITGPATWAALFQEDDIMAMTPQQRTEFVREISTAAATAVWSTPVKRDGKNVPAIQEVADAKTSGISNAARIGALEATVALLASSNSPLTVEQITAASKSGAEAALSERIEGASVTLEVTA